MGKRLLPAAFLLEFVLAASVSIRLDAGERIGEQYVDPLNKILGLPLAKPWYLVRDNDRTPYVYGRLLKVRWYSSPLDRDLNVFVMPIPEYAGYARNSDDELNPSMDNGEIPAGAIEMEVDTTRRLVDQFFHEGMQVVARGWWVEDSLHRSSLRGKGKTELHPLLHMVGTLQAQVGAVFASADHSGRFSKVEDEYLRPNFVIEAPAARDNARPDAGYHGGDAPLGLLVEDAVLDEFPDRPRSDLIAIPSEYPAEPSVMIQPSLSPHNGGNLSFYLARFERSTPQVFRDTVAYTVLSLNNGRKAVEIEIDAELTDLGSSGVSRWTLEADGAATASDLEKTTVVGGPHRATFRRTYAPSMAKDRATWTLSVQGVSPADPGYLPPTAEDQMTGSRRFLRKDRTYEIKPSRSALREEAQVAQTPTAMGMAECEVGSLVRAELTLLPGIGLLNDSVRWAASVDGSPGSPTVVSTASPVTLGPFEVARDSSEPLLVRVKRPLTLSRSARLNVGFSAETELGETVGGNVRIRAGMCSPSGGLATFLDDFLKGLVLAKKLQEAGLWTDPMPPNWSARLRTSQVGLPRGDFPEDLVKGLRGTAGRVAQTYFRLLERDGVNEAEMRSLQPFATEGGRVQWQPSDPPPASRPRPLPPPRRPQIPRPASVDGLAPARVVLPLSGPPRAVP